MLALTRLAALPSPDTPPSLASGDLEPFRTLPLVGCSYFLLLQLTWRILCSVHRAADVYFIQMLFFYKEFYNVLTYTSTFNI